jgi:hypothetical protein
VPVLNEALRRRRRRRRKRRSLNSFNGGGEPVLNNPRAWMRTSICWFCSVMRFSSRTRKSRFRL